jgi:hypothetical protein
MVTAGDPRMSIPGAENPHKVKNIVAPQMHRFRGLYGRLLSGMGGVKPADEDKVRRADLGDVGGPEEEKAEREVAWRKVGLGIDAGEGVLKVGFSNVISLWRNVGKLIVPSRMRLCSKTRASPTGPTSYRNSLER